MTQRRSATRANGSMSSSQGEGEIRKNSIETEIFTVR